MRIQPTNNYLVNKKQNRSFKSAIPIYHWTRESNGFYRVVENKKIIEILQEKLVEAFNRPHKPDHPIEIKKAIKTLRDDIYYDLRIKYNDKTNKKHTPTRSFYNDNGGWNHNLTIFKPISYLITGCDVDYFNNNFAKPLGKARAEYKYLKDGASLANLKMARHNYMVNGLNFVNDEKHQFKDINGAPCGIHTKFDVIRNSNGEIIGYKFVDMKFLPEKGSSNPFKRLAERKK